MLGDATTRVMIIAEEREQEETPGVPRDFSCVLAICANDNEKSADIESDNEELRERASE